ncbi:sulfurtransferase TusA family protein [Fuchsiella alkaliacetigena]|uniref:sulfurtransferase TusA family protein n=1 Tax=Fuchsiella alkaliacetigena TaxID=957042 RepID=UPI00200A58D8|nr:sulfurtransferase TusA family protein [Fuchsiella alkaliacetigena]MCK8825464.1 sulfurtransferase TusA family protein [Fuchsiella alkaliacetigena]
MEKKLDLLGMVCPVPLLKTKEELRCLVTDAVLKIKLDSNQSVRNVIDWLEEQGYNFELKELAAGIWEIKIVK